MDDLLFRFMHFYHGNNYADLKDDLEDKKSPLTVIIIQFILKEIIKSNKYEE
jgi:hypothetical protein